MLKTKTTLNLSILRFIAAVAIVLFSIETTSSLFANDDIQIEIVDVDLDDDNELDDEKDVFDINYIIETAIITPTRNLDFSTTSNRLPNLHLEELPSPPPERA